MGTQSPDGTRAEATGEPIRSMSAARARRTLIATCGGLKAARASAPGERWRTFLERAYSHGVPFAERTGCATSLAVVAVALIGWVDYVTGVELRVFPLYFLPLTWVARHGRAPALALATVASAAWLLSNYAAGRSYSHPGILAFNLIAQAAAFALVAWLTASLHRSLRRERELSRVDPLTGLFNLRAFGELSEREVADCKRRAKAITVAYIDIDDFKKVNEALGHRGGDDALRRVGETLLATVRTHDIAARIGGDEFVLLLPDTDEGGARTVLERLRGELTRAFEGQSFRVTASVGAVVFVQAPSSLEEMLQGADRLMYEAKVSGKNRFHLQRVDGGE